MLKKKFKFLLIVFFFILVEFFLYYRFELINLRDLYNFPDTEAKNNIIKKYQAKYEKTNNVEFYNEKVALYDGKYLNLVPKEDFSLGAKNFQKYKGGFCNEVYPNPKSKVIILGDTFANCRFTSFNKSWSYLTFNNHTNFGLNGSGPNLYKKILKSKINKNTKLIIYTFYGGNDTFDFVDFEPKENNQDYNIQNNNKKLIKKIFGKSILLNLAYSKYRNLSGNQITDYAHLIQIKNSDDIRFSKIDDGKIFNTHNLDFDEYNFAKMYSQFSPYNKKIFFEKWLKNFMEVSKVSKKNNAQIIFLYIPNTFYSFSESSTFNNKKNGNMLIKHSEKMQNIFYKICNLKKFNCVNTSNNFIQFNKVNQLPSHFPWSNNLTEYGHSLVSLVLTSYICQKKLIKNYLRNNCLSNS
jgi:hypothetical protein